jgi:hypothetical protein
MSERIMKRELGEAKQTIIAMGMLNRRLREGFKI